MKTKTAHARQQGWWRPLTWLFLVAFTLQSYVTQTHIHWQNEDRAGVAKALGKGSHGKLPGENGATDCPFCQAVVHAGAFHTPFALSLLPPEIWTELAALPALAVVLDTHVAPPWRSRAPPQH